MGPNAPHAMINLAFTIHHADGQHSLVVIIVDCSIFAEDCLLIVAFIFVVIAADIFAVIIFSAALVPVTVFLHEILPIIRIQDVCIQDVCNVAITVFLTSSGTSAIGFSGYYIAVFQHGERIVGLIGAAKSNAMDANGPEAILHGRGKRAELICASWLWAMLQSIKKRGQVHVSPKFNVDGDPHPKECDQECMN